MSNRFVDKNFFQACRKLESRLKMLFLYGWLNADDCGVYEYDHDYILVDLKGESFTEDEFKLLPNVAKIGDHKYLFTEFIGVCYKVIKEDYNPHKPAIRALERNGLILNEHRNQAIFKLAASLLNGNENGNGNEKGKEGKLELFGMFWMSYPKRKAKGDAEKAWSAIKPSAELVSTIIKKIDILRKTEDWTKDGGKFIPYPATWLRSKGWEDEVVIANHPEPIKESQYSSHGERTDL